MREVLFLLFCLLLTEGMADFSAEGHIDITSQFYPLKPDKKEGENFTAAAVLKSKYEADAFSLNIALKAQQDYYDLAEESKHTDRSFFRLDELYMQYEFEDDAISFGKSIKFWGALEVDNISDTFNLVDFRSDPFSNDKMGSWNLTYTHYSDDGEFSAIVKFYEPERAMSAYPYVYYYFPKDVSVSSTASLPLVYDKKIITQNSQYTPTVYLKYAASKEGDYPLDYAFILQHGYDSQRYFTTKLSADAKELITQENLYEVNKVTTYATMVADSTLYKVEALYCDVLDDKNVGDYIHFGVGVEHTLTQVYKEADLGLLAEYYRYITLQKEKFDDLDLYELFENDLFIGLRYSFNNGDDASIVGGTIIDLEYDEEIYYLKYESRIAELFKLQTDIRYIEPSKKHLTSFHYMGRHARFMVELSYFF